MPRSPPFLGLRAKQKYLSVKTSLALGAPLPCCPFQEKRLGLPRAVCTHTAARRRALGGSSGPERRAHGPSFGTGSAAAADGGFAKDLSALGLHLCANAGPATASGNPVKQQQLLRYPVKQQRLLNMEVATCVYV